MVVRVYHDWFLVQEDFCLLAHAGVEMATYGLPSQEVITFPVATIARDDFFEPAFRDFLHPQWISKQLPAQSDQVSLTLAEYFFRSLGEFILPTATTGMLTACFITAAIGAKVPMGDLLKGDAREAPLGVLGSRKYDQRKAGIPNPSFEPILRAGPDLRLRQCQKKLLVVLPRLR